MSTVVVERSFEAALTLEELGAAYGRGAHCLETNGVRFVRTYLARDRRRMVCLFEAPDAEAVRRVQTTFGLPVDRVWTARVVGPGGAEPAGDAVLLERVLESPLDEESIRRISAENAGCLDEWGCRLVRSYLSLDGLRILCLFAGPDTESVRQSQRQGRLPFKSAWPVTIHEAPAENG